MIFTVFHDFHSIFCILTAFSEFSPCFRIFTILSECSPSNKIFTIFSKFSIFFKLLSLKIVNVSCRIYVRSSYLFYLKSSPNMSMSLFSGIVNNKVRLYHSIFTVEPFPLFMLPTNYLYYPPDCTWWWKTTSPGGWARWRKERKLPIILETPQIRHRFLSTAPSPTDSAIIYLYQELLPKRPSR